MIKPLLYAGLLAATRFAQAQEILDRADDALFFQCEKCAFRTDLSVLADLEAYSIDENPPGLLFSNHDVLVQPRLSLFLDTTLGRHLYSLVQFRVDRGFDPGFRPSGEARFDEYLLRYTPLEQPWINLQIGKFATVYGNWVTRHDSWNNPFINAPLPYENVTAIGDNAVAPVGAFLGRKNVADKKDIWVPIIWGPSYASGASVFGTVDTIDYAVEIKNASLSSRPSEWDAFDNQWSHPTVTGRFGVRPNAAWNVGANASYGSYFISSAPVLVDHFRQLTVGPDVSFSWRHWQFWGEAMASRFEVPGVGNAETVAYYLEAKYKITPQLFAAARWNQQLFDDVTNAAGAKEAWDNDMWRTEFALGYRFTRHLQTKAQYSYSHQKGPLQQGEQMVALQVTVKF
jgi:hypothetical protein